VTTPFRFAPVPFGRAPRLADADADVPKALRKDQLSKRTEVLLAKIAALSEALYAERRRSVLVVLQGRDACGKDGVVRHVLGAVHPQGLAITAFGPPTDIELRHDYLWRVDKAVPPTGMIGVFNRSHYESVLVERVHDIVPPRTWSVRFGQINDFERRLTENGVVVLKFMLHVSRPEQRERFLERLNEPLKNWKLQEGDLDDRDRWGAYTRAYRDAIRKCNTRWARWWVVPADSKSVRNYLVAQVLCDTLRWMRPEYPVASKRLRKRAMRELS
jgi:PPK2 family polyphosphate:nucleotide phosphotransferase